MRTRARAISFGGQYDVDAQALKVVVHRAVPVGACASDGAWTREDDAPDIWVLFQVGKQSSKYGATPQACCGRADLDEFLHDAKLVLSRSAEPCFTLELNADRLTACRPICFGHGSYGQEHHGWHEACVVEGSILRSHAALPLGLPGTAEPVWSRSS
ncbi:hypothetical protein B7C42_00209 [Nocardia cerradoensis]|uniref:Uncharacterized protein n=1 Tax=Nocardia cerradoensis TaxID=85688 RepID=A0A231HEG8_9NOCA|nr:hypothetical protein [Nocardia cerradoensis]OXR47087.1 hypothetical protein B7C42_00209 [Nocardia cerradoensis]